jgi:hypothetical protein
VKDRKDRKDGKSLLVEDSNIGGCCRQPSVTGVPGKYVMIFGRRAFFGYVLSSSGEIWWFANPPSPELSRPELASLGSEQWKDRLIALFAGDAGPAVDIIRSTGVSPTGSLAATCRSSLSGGHSLPNGQQPIAHSEKLLKAMTWSSGTLALWYRPAR